MHKKQARFWIDYKGSIVRLKLDSEQVVNITFGGATDEGYSWTSERYRYADGVVSCITRTDARDCDGPISRRCIVACVDSDLSAGWFDPSAKVTYPEWQQVNYSQRDYSAESMGY